jgi:hypothetical protein
MHAFDRTASRIPLASITLVIEFTRHALIASAHRRPLIVEISTMRRAKARYALTSHHASFPAFSHPQVFIHASIRERDLLFNARIENKLEGSRESQSGKRCG